MRQIDGCFGLPVFRRDARIGNISGPGRLRQTTRSGRKRKINRTPHSLSESIRDSFRNYRTRSEKGAFSAKTRMRPAGDSIRSGGETISSPGAQRFAPNQFDQWGALPRLNPIVIDRQNSGVKWNMPVLSLDFSRNNVGNWTNAPYGGFGIRTLSHVRSKLIAPTPLSKCTDQFME